MKRKAIAISGGGGLAAIIATLMLLPGVVIEAGPDSTCAGTIIDPCYGYFNITSKDYTINLLGQNLTTYYDQSIKEEWLERKVRNKWVKLNLSKGFRFTKGVKYQFRIVVLKDESWDKVKWGVKASGAEIDPVFLPVGASDLKDFYEQEVIFKNESVRTLLVNNSCGISPTNGTMTTCTIEETTYRVTNKTVTKFSHQILTVRGKTYDSRDLNVWCWKKLPQIICKSNADGDGWLRKEGVSAGMSYFVIEDTGKMAEPPNNYKRYAGLVKE